MTRIRSNQCTQLDQFLIRVFVHHRSERAYRRCETAACPNCPRVNVPNVEQSNSSFVKHRSSKYSIISGEQLASMQLGFDQISVTQAGIQFQFMGNGDRKGKTMMVNVSCPNTCDLKSKPEEQELIGRACFVRWGLSMVDPWSIFCRSSSRSK